jgi:hypothetical protein
MIVSGGLLGTLLDFPLASGKEIWDVWNFWSWAIFFVPWQAGYAAAFATALPAAGSER